MLSRSFVRNICSVDAQHQKQALICIRQREISVSFSNSTKPLVCCGAANAKLNTCPGLNIADSVKYSPTFL